MITATASQVREILVNDPAFLHGVLVGLDDALGEAGCRVAMRQVLEALPDAIAARSPFSDANLVAAVQAETRRVLYRLTMDVLPAKGRA